MKYHVVGCSIALSGAQKTGKPRRIRFLVKVYRGGKTGSGHWLSGLVLGIELGQKHRKLLLHSDTHTWHKACVWNGE